MDSSRDMEQDRGRIRVLQRMKPLDIRRFLVGDLRLALKQLPPGTVETCLVLRLLRMRLASGSLEQLLELRTRGNMSKYPEVLRVLQHYDLSFLRGAQGVLSHL